MKTGGDQGKVLQAFLLDGNQEKNTPASSLLHFYFNVITLQPFNHEIFVMAGREPGSDRLPTDPAAASALSANATAATVLAEISKTVVW